MASKTGIALFLLLWLTPVAYICGLVYRYSVDVPFDDDFAIGDDIHRWAMGTIRWADLIAQHNESRPFFPRIVFSILATHLGWDVRYQMAASVLLVAVTSVLSFVLALRTIEDYRSACTIALLTNLLLFSPVQWMNFLWGIQFITFVPALCLLMVILSITLIHRMWVVVSLAGVAALIATYSNSNGLLVWIVPLPLFFTHRSHFRMPGLTSWVILMFCACVFYFHGYQSPGDPPLLLALRQPLLAMRFILAFLGNGVRRNDNVTSAFIAGLFIASLWGSGLLYAALRCRTADIWRNLLPWIVLGMYSIASGVMAMLGRLVHFGLPGAVPERYPTFAIPIWLAVIPLWAVLLEHTIPKNTKTDRAAIFLTWMISLLIAGMTFRAAYSVRNDIRYY